MVRGGVEGQFAEALAGELGLAALPLPSSRLGILPAILYRPRR